LFTWDQLQTRIFRRPAALLTALVIVLFASAPSGAGAGPPVLTPAPAGTAAAQIRSTGSLSARSTSSTALKAQFAALAAVPRRTFRLRQTAIALAGVRQDTIVAASGAAQRYADAHYCDQHPLQLARVSGDVTPGGTITATGACFGPPAGQIKMLGNFPNEKGAVSLVVLTWTDQSVTAKIPAITRALDQAVDIRLQRPATTMGLHDKGTGQTVSSSARMSFVAQRQVLEVSTQGTSWSCGRGAHPLTEDCGAADLCSWTTSCLWAEHIQTASDSGNDTWQVHLPAGWRFDHLELSGQDGNTTLAIDSTLDPTNVSWSVHWQTLHSKTEASANGNHRTYTEKDDGSYAIILYVSIPIGTYTPSAAV
jgi:hypothetical protein